MRPLAGCRDLAGRHIQSSPAPLAILCPASQKARGRWRVATFSQEQVPALGWAFLSHRESRLTLMVQTCHPTSRNRQEDSSSKPSCATEQRPSQSEQLSLKTQRKEGWEIAQCAQAPRLQHCKKEMAPREKCMVKVTQEEVGLRIQTHALAILWPLRTSEMALREMAERLRNNKGKMRPVGEEGAHKSRRDSQTQPRDSEMGIWGRG